MLRDCRDGCLCLWFCCRLDAVASTFSTRKVVVGMIVASAQPFPVFTTAPLFHVLHSLCDLFSSLIIYSIYAYQKAFGCVMYVVFFVARLGYPTSPNTYKPCGIDAVKGNEQGHYLTAGHPICTQACTEDRLGALFYGYPYQITRMIDDIDLFGVTDDTNQVCRTPNEACQRRTIGTDDSGRGCAGICRERATVPRHSACFLSTLAFENSVLTDGCGPDRHGSGYPLFGNKNTFDTDDTTLSFYGQENSKTSGRQIWTHLTPVTPDTSFTNDELSGPSAFIQPDKDFVSDNVRESKPTPACSDHEQCLHNSPRGNGLNKGEQIGFHRIYTHYFEGTTPTFEDVDLVKTNLVRNEPTCGAHMHTKLYTARGMRRGCVDTPGWVSDFDVRTLEGDAAAHAPVYSAYLSKKPGSLQSKSEFDFIWTTLWGKTTVINGDLSASAAAQVRKLTSGPLPSAFFREWCSKGKRAFTAPKHNKTIPGIDTTVRNWDDVNMFPPFDGTQWQPNNVWIHQSAALSNAFEMACTWLDGSDDAAAFGAQPLNREIAGKFYHNVSQLIKNEQRNFIRSPHGRIMNPQPLDDKEYDSPTNGEDKLSLVQLLTLASNKTCAWFRKYYCYESHFTEQRAQDEHSEKSLFDFYGPGRHCCGCRILSANHAISDKGLLYRPKDPGDINITRSANYRLDPNASEPTYLKNASRSGWLPDGFSGGMPEYDTSDQTVLVGWCIGLTCYTGGPLVYSDTPLTNTTIQWLVKDTSTMVVSLVHNTAIGLRLGVCAHVQCRSFDVTAVAEQDQLMPLPEQDQLLSEFKGYLFLNNKDSRGFYDTSDLLPFYDPPAYDRSRNEYGDPEDQRAQQWSSWYDQSNDNARVIDAPRPQYLYTDGDSPTPSNSPNAFDTSMFVGHGTGEYNLSNTVTKDGEYETTVFQYNFANVGDLFLPSRESCNPTKWYTEPIELSTAPLQSQFDDLPSPLRGLQTKSTPDQTRKEFSFDASASTYFTLNNSHVGVAVYTTPEWKRKTGLGEAGPDGLNVFERSKTMFYDEGPETNGYVSYRHRALVTQFERPLEGVLTTSTLASFLNSHVRPSCNGTACSHYAVPNADITMWEDMVTCWAPLLPTPVEDEQCFSNTEAYACIEYNDTFSYPCFAEKKVYNLTDLSEHYSAGARRYLSEKHFLDNATFFTRLKGYNDNGVIGFLLDDYLTNSVEDGAFITWYPFGNNTVAVCTFDNLALHYEHEDVFSSALKLKILCAYRLSFQHVYPIHFTLNGFNDDPTEVFWDAVLALRFLNNTDNVSCVNDGCWAYATKAGEHLVNRWNNENYLQLPLREKYYNSTEFYTTPRPFQTLVPHLSRGTNAEWVLDDSGQHFRFLNQYSLGSIPEEKFIDFEDYVAENQRNLKDWVVNTYIPNMRDAFELEEIEIRLRLTYHKVTKPEKFIVRRERLSEDNHAIFPLGSMAMFSDASGEINSIRVVERPNLTETTPKYYANISNAQGFVTTQAKTGVTFPLLVEAEPFDDDTFPGELLDNYSYYPESRMCARFHDGPVNISVLCPDDYRFPIQRPVRVEIALPPSTATTVADAAVRRPTVCGPGNAAYEPSLKYTAPYFRDPPMTLSANQNCGILHPPADETPFGRTCIRSNLVCRPQSFLNESLYTPGVYKFTGAIDHAQGDLSEQTLASPLSALTCQRKCFRYGRGSGVPDGNECVCGTVSENIVGLTSSPALMLGHGAMRVKSNAEGPLSVPVFGPLTTLTGGPLTIEAFVEVTFGDISFTTWMVPTVYYLNGYLNFSKLEISPPVVRLTPVGSSAVVILNLSNPAEPPFSLLDGPLEPPVVVGTAEIFVRVNSIPASSATPLAAVSSVEPPEVLVGNIGDPHFNITEAGVLYHPGDSPERVLFAPDTQVTGATAKNGFLGLAMYEAQYVANVDEECVVYRCDTSTVHWCPGDTLRLLAGRECVPDGKTTGFVQHSPGVVLRPRARWVFVPGHVHTAKVHSLNDCIYMAQNAGSTYASFNSIGAGSCQHSQYIQAKPEFSAAYFGTSIAIHIGTTQSKLYEFTGSGFNYLITIEAHVTGFAYDPQDQRYLYVANTQTCQNSQLFELLNGHTTAKDCVSVHMYSGSSLQLSYDTSPTTLVTLNAFTENDPFQLSAPSTFYVQAFEDAACSGLCLKSYGPFTFTGQTAHDLIYSNCVDGVRVAKNKASDDMFSMYSCSLNRATFKQSVTVNGCGTVLDNEYGKLSTTMCPTTTPSLHNFSLPAYVSITVGNATVIVTVDVTWQVSHQGLVFCQTLHNYSVGIEFSERNGLSLVRYGVTQGTSAGCLAYSTYAGCTDHRNDLVARFGDVPNITACVASPQQQAALIVKPFEGGGTFETMLFSNAASCHSHKAAVESGIQQEYTDMCLRVNFLPASSFEVVQAADGSWSGDVMGVIIEGDKWPEKRVIDQCDKRLSYYVLLGPTNNELIEPTLCGGCPKCDDVCIEPPEFTPVPSLLDGSAVIIGIVASIGFNVRPPAKTTIDNIEL